MQMVELFPVKIYSDLKVNTGRNESNLPALKEIISQTD